MNNGNDIIYELGKIAVEGYYDYQQIRISQKNRVRDVVRRKIEGIPLDKPEEKKEHKKYDDKFKDKNIFKFLGELVLDGKINDLEKKYIEKLHGISIETEKTETNYKGLMDQYLFQEKLWSLWLEKIRGISSVLGSNLLKNFGYCENYEYVSSLWRHTGFDPDGAKGRKKGETISYNPKLKTLVWKIGDSFMKQRTQPYRRIYDSEKIRQLKLLENAIKKMSEDEKKKWKKLSKKKDARSFLDGFNPFAPVSLLNADFRARRKMVKIFLQHYWIIGRQIKELPITKPYPIDKMGHTHYIEPPFNPFAEGDVTG